MDGGVSERPVVVTLVHGTWGQEASWIGSDSPLRTAISGKLSPPVTFVPFRWSGRNSHKARLAATKALEEQILRTAAEQPESCHVAVAHSHGGNIAVYALRNPEVAASVSGLVTLATPFLCMTPRPVGRVIQIVTTFLTVYTHVSAVMGVLWLLLRATESVALPVFHGGSAIAAAVVFLIAGLWFMSAMWKLSKRLVGTVMAYARETAEQKQSDVISRLCATPCNAVPTLSVSFSMDEAGVSLRMIQMLAGAAPRLAGWLSASTTFLFGIVSFLFALGVLLGLLSIVGVPVLRQYNTIWSVVAILFLLSFQGFVAFQTASFVLPSLARSTGFGPEDPLSAMLVRISVADSLPGPSVERRRYSLSHALGALRPDFKNRTFVSPRLIHSLAYLYPPALDDISSWIGHVRKTAPPLSRSAASRARASK